MKKTIKTADLLAYLTSEIEACEAAAERYCKALQGRSSIRQHKLS